MEAKSLDYYRKQIRNAKTKEELSQISYLALRDDPECTAFSKKYNKIVGLCVRRELELRK